MNKEDDKTECCEGGMKYKHHGHGGNSNAIYGLSVIGALFYFLQNASTLTAVLIGIGKSIFWPAILMFKLLTFLKL